MDMKQCTKCGLEKSIDEFSEQRKSCRPCDAAYARKRSRTPEGRAAQKRFRESESGREYRRNYGRAYTLERWHNNPEARHKILARNSVGMALRYGALVRPGACEHCGGGGEIQAHHHKGYAEEYRRDVEWLCRECHKAADALMVEQELVA